MYNMVEKLALPIKVADRMDEITFLISILWTKKLKFRQVIKKLIKITQRSGEARIQVNIYLQRCSFYQITLCLKWGFPHSSAGKESACNAGDPGSIHGQEDPWRRDRLSTPVSLEFCGLAGKESACDAGDLGLIPALRRSPGEGNGYPLQPSDLENSMKVHGVAKSQTQLSNFHTT